MIYPNLTKIRSFISVAEHGGFRKAAENLNLSQPALSAHVRDLEALLGISLFHRTTRSVRLTTEGENFLARSKRAFGELEAAVLEARDQAALQRGRVILACVPTIASHVLPPVLVVFAQRYPAITIRVLDEGAQSLNRRVLTREADIGIGPRPDRGGELEFQTMVHDHFVGVFRRDHPLAARRTIRVKDLVRYPFLTLTAGANVRVILAKAFAQQGFSLEPAFEVVNHYTLGGMVEAGLGITALPSMAISMLSNPLLKTVRIVNPEITREVGILYRSDQRHTPAVNAFLVALAEGFKNLGPTVSAGSPRASRRLHVPALASGRQGSGQRQNRMDDRRSYSTPMSDR